jgi:hypothetical protein
VAGRDWQSLTLIMYFGYIVCSASIMLWHGACYGN